MVISNMIKSLRHYCRCICIWQCCTTLQDFEPDFNDHSKDSSNKSEDSVSQIANQHGYLTFHSKDQEPKFVSDCPSQTSSSKSKPTTAKIVTSKLDELEYLLSNKPAITH